MLTPDLFWHPAVGELVLIRPGTHAAQFRKPDELARPLRVTRDGLVIDGHPMVWCTPTWPVTRRTDRNGRVIVETPTSQSPMLVDELMPYLNAAQEQALQECAP